MAMALTMALAMGVMSHWSGHGIGRVNGMAMALALGMDLNNRTPCRASNEIPPSFTRKSTFIFDMCL